MIHYNNYICNKLHSLGFTKHDEIERYRNSRFLIDVYIGKIFITFCLLIEVDGEIHATHLDEITVYNTDNIDKSISDLLKNKEYVIYMRNEKINYLKGKINATGD